MIDLDRPNTFLTVEDVARLTRLSRATIRNAIRAGELRASAIRGRYRIRVDDVEAWLDRATEHPARVGGRRTVEA